MLTYAKTTVFAVAVILLATAVSAGELEMLETARAAVAESRAWVGSRVETEGFTGHIYSNGSAIIECEKLYEESEIRLSTLIDVHENFTVDDAITWLGGVLVNHRTCLEGLEQKGLAQKALVYNNVTLIVSKSLALYRKGRKNHVNKRPHEAGRPNQSGGMLVSWNPTRSKADFVVAKDGSGGHRSINEALTAVSRMGPRRSGRVIIYIKSGVYNEKIDIDRKMKNIMLVGDGIDRTIVTGSSNVPDGATTYGSATFGVSGDGFWARDMTFENTAGPHKHQAVALRVSSDLSVFYRCSFKGYQDTLFTHSLRQFYRDCHIYGTIDFIFGDAAAVFQNCDIFVRRPMDHQANMITAQGRDNPHTNTGISIQESRVRPAPELEVMKSRFRSYLGRPWKKYSRTVFMKTDLDGLIHPNGWTEWSGAFALSTLYYGEYMNTGAGARTDERVKWPGFHVLRGSEEASPFSVSRFIQGESWIPATGVPFHAGV
ncbi:PREDICTED: probable pectinesterase/pectinesterase inhibitor 36 isoform X2 [Tarenaya hassleriana]|uniref:probable pectinesterase/pectinesterase inhibitor 36 isoform X1 n=1 Tax=Tarenaya hassleriana TaxID=28532 RepID=UPI00053C31DE|nr:PREDICTED: probable pectinesterase/pectinesterase inhibitor 36 isoform X1 [Tarenaya hassleriana]XP_019058501.1 PREDICTED: probable pectinesterase/pectinesterase inhibitor 36 isoform X2 [Tarenaya hassleriana]